MGRSRPGVILVGRVGPAPRRLGLREADPGRYALQVALEALGRLAGYPLPEYALEALRLVGPVVQGLARAGGRGGDPRGLGAAAAYYALVVGSGLRGSPAGLGAGDARKRLGVPRSSWYRALRIVWDGMGHSPLLWGSFLRGYLSGRLVSPGGRLWCRPGEVVEVIAPGRVAWSRRCIARSRPRVPAFPGGVYVVWVSRCGVSSGGGVLGGIVWVQARIRFDAERFVGLLESWFGGDEFTAEDVAARLGATPASIARLLGELARGGFLERRRSGMGGYRYRVPRR